MFFHRCVFQPLNHTANEFLRPIGPQAAVGLMRLIR